MTTTRVFEHNLTLTEHAIQDGKIAWSRTLRVGEDDSLDDGLVSFELWDVTMEIKESLEIVLDRMQCECLCDYLQTLMAQQTKIEFLGQAER